MAVDLEDEVTLADAGRLGGGGAVHSAHSRGELSGEGEAETILALRDGDLEEGTKWINVMKLSRFLKVLKNSE